MPAGVRLGVLGPLEVRVNDVVLSLGGVKQRTVLALLLTEPNRIVPLTRIIDALWGERSADKASSTVQVHVSNLRKALAPATEALGVKELVSNEPPGYVLRAPEDTVDLMLFQEHVRRARRARESRRLAEAVRAWRDGLGLWRGEPLADLANEDFAGPIATRLDSLRISALEECLDAELALGRHGELLTELTSLVEQQPLNEVFRGMLMVALYRAGRQADALAQYQDARRVLVEELGIEPSPPLRELESKILAQDGGLAAPGAVADVIDVSTMLGTSVVIRRGVLVGATEQHPLDRPVVTIGRRPEHDVVLDDPKVSRDHAEIRLQVGASRLVDLGSTNGTSVNGDRVTELDLAPGDVVTFGNSSFRFELRD